MKETNKRNNYQTEVKQLSTRDRKRKKDIKRNLIIL